MTENASSLAVGHALGKYDTPKPYPINTSSQNKVSDHTLSTSVMGVLQVAFQALSSSFSSSSARRFFATLEKIKT